MSWFVARPVLLAALLLAMAGAWAGSVERLAAAQIPRQPGPGLGDIAGRADGTPVSLVLPGGYTLVSVRGDATLAYISECLLEEEARNRPECSADRGDFQVTLVMRFDPAAYVRGQDTNHAACRSGGPEEWAGWLLVSEDGRGQNVLLPTFICATVDGGVTPVLELPPPLAGARAGSTVEFTLSGYCVNLSRAIPGRSDSYSVGVITEDAGLRLVIAAIDGKDLYLEESRSIIQDVIWDYTDGDGLTEALLDELRLLP